MPGTTILAFAMDGSITVHSSTCLDPKTSIRKRCKDCIKKYRNEKQSVRRQNKKELIKNTSCVVDKNRSIYSEVLCAICRENPNNDFCENCRNKYNCAKSSRSYKKTKTEGSNCNTDRVIIYERPFHANQPNPTNVDISVRDDDNNSKGVHCAASCNSDINYKTLPTYSDILCAACQNKSFEKICPECKLKYNRASSKKHYTKSRQKKYLETIDLNNQTNLTDQIQQVQGESGNCCKSFIKKRKKNSVKSNKNRLSKARKMAATPNRQEDLGVDLIVSLPDENKNNAIRRLNFKSEQDLQAEISTKVILDIKEQFGGKSQVSYKVMTILSPNFAGKSQTHIKKILKVNWENAGKVKSRVDLSRKIYRKKLTQELITKIELFYEREDISRIEPSMKASKKWGPKRFLKFSINDAYLMFKNENIDLEVCLSNFYKFKPRNVKISTKTPIISSQCPYCINIRLKLQRLGIPNLKMEHELFKNLICEKDYGKLENADCVKKKCNDCLDWVGKLDILLSNVSYKNADMITWFTWKKENFVRANGQKGVCRNLIRNTETFKLFKEELIEDIMHPAKRFSFIEHYMAQKFQYKAYKECLSSLKPGQCLMVQDFAKNRDITYQDEIKCNFWVKKQVTMHPTVIFYRLEDEGEIHRLVITHLSDITDHDAHIVHFMTLDCLSTLKEMHPEIEWTKTYIWSDGCASQYKGKISFYYLNKFPIAVERNFFASEHGKGPSDAETGLISMQLSNATKARRAVIKNASEMHTFLTENNKDKTRIFKLVKDGDLQPILEAYDGIKVSTLRGACTRSLHQIKPSDQNGYLLQRPFSCFCYNCINDNFEKCDKKSFTEGIFKKQKLPSNDLFCSLLNNNDDDDEEEIEDVITKNANGHFDEVEDEVEDEEEIERLQQTLNLEDLKPGKYVIVALNSENKKKGVREYVAKINEIEDEEEICIDYLEEDRDYGDKFRISDRLNDVNQGIELFNIIMVLPDPQKIRGGVIFPTRINLIQNLIYFIMTY